MSCRITEIPLLPLPMTLQSAAVAFSMNNETALTPHGCLDSHGNCTAACQNLTQVFSSMETFHNCLAYPTIDQIVSEANTTMADKSLAGNYGISGTTGNTSSSVVNSVVNCLAGYCSSNQKCSAFDSGTGPCLDLINSTSFPVSFSISAGYEFYGTLGCIQTICNAVQQTAAVNVDIGGIGVSHKSKRCWLSVFC